MKKIMQFRYWNDNNSFNSPSTLTGDDLASGSLFSTYGSISALGVQGPPGLKFYLNNGDYPIIIGNTGIYQLDMNGVNKITSISFPGLASTNGDPDQKELLTQSRKLIIDIVYGGGA